MASDMNKEEVQENMDKSNIVTYPAVFFADEADGYTVAFPDIDQAHTRGASLGASLVNATTVLGRALRNRPDQLPAATTLTELTHRYPSEFIQFVAVDLEHVPEQALPEDDDVQAVG